MEQVLCGLPPAENSLIDIRRLARNVSTYPDMLISGFGFLSGPPLLRSLAPSPALTNPKLIPYVRHH